MSAVFWKELWAVKGQPRLFLLICLLATVLGVVAPVRRVLAALEPERWALAEIQNVLPILPLVLAWVLVSTSVHASRVRGETTILRLSPLSFIEIWLGTCMAVLAISTAMSVLAWLAYGVLLALFGVDVSMILSALEVLWLLVVTGAVLISFVAWIVLALLAAPGARTLNLAALVLVLAGYFVGLPELRNRELVFLMMALLTSVLGAAFTASRLMPHTHLRAGST